MTTVDPSVPPAGVPEIRTLEVRTQHEGVFRIEVPANWKITFSKVNPQSGMHDSMALRIYEADERQRACFTGVVSFRDLSIPFTRRVRLTKEQASSERGPKGSKASRQVAHEYEWVSGADDDHSPF